MLKRMTLRFINSFCYSIAITLTVQAISMAATGGLPLLPEYAARFSDPVKAYALQLLLIGVMSAVTGAGTVIFEAKRIGQLAQSLLFLAVMLSVWIPVACIAWGFHKYTASMVSTLCSLVVTFAICRGILYRLCQKDIKDINDLLSEKRGE